MGAGRSPLRRCGAIPRLFPENYTAYLMLQDRPVIGPSAHGQTYTNWTEASMMLA